MGVFILIQSVSSNWCVVGDTLGSLHKAVKSLLILIYQVHHSAKDYQKLTILDIKFVIFDSLFVSYSPKIESLSFFQYF